MNPTPAEPKQYAVSFRIEFEASSDSEARVFTHRVVTFLTADCDRPFHS
jgi:hypothetical protein